METFGKLPLSVPMTFSKGFQCLSRIMVQKQMIVVHQTGDRCVIDGCKLFQKFQRTVFTFRQFIVLIGSPVYVQKISYLLLIHTVFTDGNSGFFQEWWKVYQNLHIKNVSCQWHCI